MPQRGTQISISWQKKKKKAISNFKITTELTFPHQGRAELYSGWQPLLPWDVTCIQIIDGWNKWNKKKKEGIHFLLCWEKSCTSSEPSFPKDRLISLHLRPSSFLVSSPHIMLHHFCLLSHPHLSHFFHLSCIIVFSFPVTMWMTFFWSELEYSIFMVSKWQKSHQQLEKRCLKAGRWTRGGK